jgi:hypothetical protein
MLVDLTIVELSEMQNDESIRTLFNIKGTMAWLCDGPETKCPNSTTFCKKITIAPPLVIFS